MGYDELTSHIAVLSQFPLLGRATALKSNDRDQRRSRLLGLGLDGTDGHTRLTRGDDFILYGGSEETHSRMQETTIKLNEKLKKSGRRIGDVPPRELGDLLRESMD